MKRQLLFTMGGLIATLSVMAQVTMTQSNFIRAAAFSDTVYRAEPTSITLPPTGPSQSWDFSTLVYKDTRIDVFYDAKDSVTGYPSAYTFAEYPLAGAFGTSFPGYEFIELDANSYSGVAFYTEGNVDNLMPLTGNAADKLEILPQRINYAGERDYMVFPTTYQSTWQSTSRRSTQFQLTITAQGLNQTPGSFDFIEELDREVVGYGTLIIPDENGVPMPAIDVIHVESNANEIDSIFLGGAPAPTSLLTSFGRIQGEVTTDRFFLFYSPGSGRSIAAYGVDGSSNITYFLYLPSASRNAAKFMSAGEILSSEIGIYPNPASSDQSLHIELENFSFVKHVVINDIMGRAVKTFNIGRNVNLIDLELSGDIAPSIYYLELKGENSEVLARKAIQVK